MLPVSIGGCNTSEYRWLQYHRAVALLVEQVYELMRLGALCCGGGSWTRRPLGNVDAWEDGELRQGGMEVDMVGVVEGWTDAWMDGWMEVDIGGWMGE